MTSKYEIDHVSYMGPHCASKANINFSPFFRVLHFLLESTVQGCTFKGLRPQPRRTGRTAEFRSACARGPPRCKIHTRSFILRESEKNTKYHPGTPQIHPQESEKRHQVPSRYLPTVLPQVPPQFSPTPAAPALPQYPTPRNTSPLLPQYPTSTHPQYSFPNTPPQYYPSTSPVPPTIFHRTPTVLPQSTAHCFPSTPIVLPQYLPNTNPPVLAQYSQRQASHLSRKNRSTSTNRVSRNPPTIHFPRACKNTKDTGRPPKMTLYFGSRALRARSLFLIN